MIKALFYLVVVGTSNCRIFYAICQYKNVIFCENMKGGKNLIYDNIRDACTEAGISVSKLERELGFPRSSICKWNENEPSARKLYKVAKHLKINMEQLLTDAKK